MAALSWVNLANLSLLKQKSYRESKWQDSARVLPQHMTTKVRITRTKVSIVNICDNEPAVFPVKKSTSNSMTIALLTQSD